MYNSFFAFSERPFDVTPDPKFLYLSPSHRETLAALIYGIEERRGFIAVIGEVGTGKTTLINSVIDRLDEKTKVACIFNTDMRFEQLLTMALAELDLVRPDERITKVEAIERLNHFALKQMAQGGNVVLIVDEAQNLDDSSMENLRLLSNLETRKQKFIQIVLSGQPELEAKLNRPELRQVNQRISLKRFITPLSEKETYEYVAHRLKIAGDKKTVVFSSAAQKAIWEYAGGIPRKINILCDNALLIAYAREKKKIKEDVLQEAVRDLTWNPYAVAVPIPGGQQERKQSKILDVAFRPKFAFSGSLVLAVCAGILFAHNFFPFRLQMNEKEYTEEDQIIYVPIRNAAPLKPHPIIRPANSVEKAERPEIPAAPPVREPRSFSDLTTPLDESMAPRRAGEPEKGIANEKISLTIEKIVKDSLPEPVTNGALEGLAAGTAAKGIKGVRQFIVKEGDCISSIMIRAYGEYDPNRLKDVLHANPHIESPDLIRTGEMIVLPAADG